MSTATSPCRHCGAAIPASARFCESCGADQAEAPEPDQAVEAGSAEAQAAASGSEGQSSSPAAGEFVQLLRSYGQLPGVRLAVLSALIGAGIVLAFGFLLAATLPADSFVDLSEEGESNLWRETFTHSATTSLAAFQLNFEDGSFALRTAPLLFVLVPTLGCGFGSYLLAKRTDAAPQTLSYAWGAAVGVPFALLMLIFSLLSGSEGDSGATISISDGSVFLLGLLWGVIGGLLGTAWSLRGQAHQPVQPNPIVGRIVITLREAVKPLGLSLLILAVVGTGIWVVQTIRDASETRGDRSVATALMDDVLYAGDLGYRYQALGSGSQFQMLDNDFLAALFAFSIEEEDDDETTTAQFLPIPLSESQISGKLIQDGDVELAESTFRIFNYGDALPAYVFAPLLLILMVVPAFFALYAGFAVAKANAAATHLQRAAYGAAIGPIWAAAMVLLNTLGQDLHFGQIDSESLFVLTLLIGAGLGALGGLGANQLRTGSETTTV